VVNGYQALFGNTTGTRNIGVGGNALLNNATGNDNVGIGSGHAVRRRRLSSNVAVGSNALSKARGRLNIALGQDAGANVIGVHSDSIEIGQQGPRR
jgi:hypothetical protein